MRYHVARPSKVDRRLDHCSLRLTRRYQIQLAEQRLKPTQLCTDMRNLLRTTS